MQNEKSKQQEEKPHVSLMRKFRFENKLSQAAMAEMLGIRQQKLSDLESGAQDPKLDFILLYERVTGINLATSEVSAESVEQRTIRLLRLEVQNCKDVIRAKDKRIEVLEERIKNFEPVGPKQIVATERNEKNFNTDPGYRRNRRDFHQYGNRIRQNN
jgi:transcriptional regulator with XRE-family HTH domain